MKKRLENLRLLIIPAFVILCVVLGGSAQSTWGKMALQLISVLLIGWAALVQPREKSHETRALFALVIGSLVLLVVQLIPLPPAIWTEFPGRAVVERGFAVLEMALPWLSVSLAAFETLDAALFLLPSIAALLGILRIGAYRDSWVAAAIAGATLISVILGYLQISSGRFAQSDWYLYDSTNVGSAVGFFANRNHMGTLLLVAVPFVVALMAASPARNRRTSVPTWIAGTAALVVILAGIAMNGSLAAVLIAVPVIIASALLFPGGRRFRSLGFVVAAIGLIGALVILTNTQVREKLIGKETSSIEGRQDIWANTLTAISETFPVGTGFGTFEAVYATIEDPGRVPRSYINHAHNDYLEVVLEGGAVAVLLVVLFLLWWFRQSLSAWRRDQGDVFTRAAVISSAVVLIHSIVDYPLRTTTIAAIFAFCIAVLARPMPRDLKQTARRERSKHLKIG